MRKHFEDINHIYIFVFLILVLIFGFATTLRGIVLEDATEYYFFLANRYKDSYQYTGKYLEIKTEPKGYKEHPAYIFKNRLLFLYYGYTATLKKAFSAQYKLSFDVYPEQFFKKIYQLDGKIISFEIDLLRSPRGVYALEYELNLSERNICTARFIFRNNDGNIIDITDKKLQREFFIPYTYKMHFEIISDRNDIALYINSQLISRGQVAGEAGAGLFNLNKFPGSQFQMDNLIITDSRTGREVIREDFDKYVNFFDIKEWFFPHTRVFFIIMLFVLAAFGYAFDICLVFLSRLFGPELLWLKFIVPQVLALLAINRFCSLSIEPGLCVVFSIVAVKIIYTAVNLSKRNAQVE